MAFLDELKDQLLFDYQNEFYNERGLGCRYRLVLAGTELFAKYLKDPTDVREVAELITKEKLAAGVEMSEDEFQISEAVRGCVFAPLCDRFPAVGIQPLCCPLTNALMRAVELRDGLPPELLSVERAGDLCRVAVARMGNDGVVDAKGVF